MNDRQERAYNTATDGLFVLSGATSGAAQALADAQARRSGPAAPVDSSGSMFGDATKWIVGGALVLGAVMLARR